MAKFTLPKGRSNTHDNRSTQRPGTESDHQNPRKPDSQQLLELSCEIHAHFEKAMCMLEAARPASGFRPETPQEWRALQAAEEELLFATLVGGGMAPESARHLARVTFNGPLGKFLIDLAFSEEAHVKR